MITINNLHKSFDTQKVLNGINLSIEEGQTFALIGGSGKGKSVLLKHIIGLLRPDEGEVLIAGQNIHNAHGKQLRMIKERMGVVFQLGALFDSLTVYENVAFPLEEKTKLSSSEIKAKVIEELKSVGLEKDRHKYPAQISGGMKKRAALARCLIMDPEIIFFDEPTTGLDPVIAKSIYKLILSLQKKRKLTAIIISHDIPGIFTIVDQVAMLHNGQIVEVGTTKDIQNSENKIIKQFLSGELE